LSAAVDVFYPKAPSTWEALQKGDGKNEQFSNRLAMEKKEGHGVTVTL